MLKLVNNNISPLPFYDNIALQNHRKDYAFGHIYQLISPVNFILPFQVVLSGGTAVSAVTLHDYNTGETADVTTLMVDGGLALKTYDDEDFTVLIYPGVLPVTAITHEGLYYLEIEVTELGTLYSDLFTAVNDVSDFLMLEYRNSYNFEFTNGIVDFSNGFMFRCYLNTQIGRPDYEFEEEATERMGYSYVESQVSKKIYKFVFIAPEYLCDALRIVRLCDNKQIYSKLRTYDLTAFSMEPDWQEQGDLAAVECEFETDTVIANIGGYTTELLGDFNEDFNEDYKIS